MEKLLVVFLSRGDTARVRFIREFLDEKRAATAEARRLGREAKHVEAVDARRRRAGSD